MARVFAKVMTAEDIEVRKVDGLKFNGKMYKGWALYVEGLGFMAFEGEDIPYMLGTKKYATAIKNGWGFDWDYTIVTAD